MKWDKERYVFFLDSGTRLYAQNGAIGINPLLDERPHCGFDDEITIEDRVEIATAMVKRWTEWGGL